MREPSGRAWAVCEASPSKKEQPLTFVPRAPSRFFSINSLRDGTPQRRRSGQLGDDLHEFRLRPCATSASVHIAMRAERQRKFGDIIAVRCIDEEDEIAVACGEIKMLDLDAHLLGEIAPSLHAFRRILDSANSLVSPLAPFDPFPTRVVPFELEWSLLKSRVAAWLTSRGRLRWSDITYPVLVRCYRPRRSRQK